MPVIDLIVLASSRKGGGRCVAGYDLNSGGWVRPVSAGAEGALQLDHCRVEGDWPQLFDVVRLELTDPKPEPWQPENWLIADSPWKLVERVEPAEITHDILSLVEHDVALLDTTNRKIPSSNLEQNPIAASLALVKPKTLNWRIEIAPWGARQQKANFEIEGRGWFDLHVTDPLIEAHLISLSVGSHERDAVGIDQNSTVLLTLSLSEPYDLNGDCYKLVAGVLELAPQEPISRE